MQFSRCLNIIRTKVTSLGHLQDLLLRYLKEIFLWTNWTRYIDVSVLSLNCVSYRKHFQDILKTSAKTCISRTKRNPAHA